MQRPDTILCEIDSPSAACAAALAEVAVACARDRGRQLRVRHVRIDHSGLQPPTLVLHLSERDLPEKRRLHCLACRLASICPGARIHIREQTHSLMNNKLVIYYATETGNCETLARQTCERAHIGGWSAEIRNLGDFHPSDLVINGPAVFIVSTWGDGEPPSYAIDFFNELNQPHAPSLAGLQHAVLGLGDSSYEHFNVFARQLDERLAELGSQRFLERVECDLDYEQIHATWTEAMLSTLAGCSA
ncbi:MAG: flavodoxin domain-containing protein [Verrucomicrobia bacterium]|nr:flavodoxin domain-containing protein [Verrucomicrobiota bacterium]